MLWNKVTENFLNGFRIEIALITGINIFPANSSNAFADPLHSGNFTQAFTNRDISALSSLFITDTNLVLDKFTIVSSKPLIAKSIFSRVSTNVSFVLV
ncbi:hypothetical protein [Leptospira alexanderi]|uniref:hypothetical protein n=1 Tax=Leptospira alexanderi TaxID=100053 RepID=UPI0011159771|nr:hypothetical protein [Leptospira alexanderi]